MTLQLLLRAWHCALLVIALFLAGCDSGGGSGGHKPAAPVLTSSEAHPELCLHGATLFSSGIDLNRDNVLGADEVTATTTVCQNNSAPVFDEIFLPYSYTAATHTVRALPVAQTSYASTVKIASFYDPNGDVFTATVGDAPAGVTFQVLPMDGAPGEQLLVVSGLDSLTPGVYAVPVDVSDGESGVRYTFEFDVRARYEIDYSMQQSPAYEGVDSEAYTELVFSEPLPMNISMQIDFNDFAQAYHPGGMGFVNSGTRVCLDNQVATCVTGHGYDYYYIPAGTTKLGIYTPVPDDSVFSPTRGLIDVFVRFASDSYNIPVCGTGEQDRCVPSVSYYANGWSESNFTVNAYDNDGSVTASMGAASMSFGSVYDGLWLDVLGTGSAPAVWDTTVPLYGSISGTATSGETFTVTGWLGSLIDDNRDGTYQGGIQLEDFLPASWIDAIGSWTFTVTLNPDLGVVAAAPAAETVTEVLTPELLRTWVNGLIDGYAAPVYGTLGEPDIANTPGGRWQAMTWSDASGNLWLFGGASDYWGASYSLRSDVWKFDGSNWIWVGGSNATGASGVYGVRGVAGTANMPGAREAGVTWRDKQGNFWLFGGIGYGGSGDFGLLNDLWKFDGNSWTFVSGSASASAQPSYGVLGMADDLNVPGGRELAASWVDSAGNLWLFGGQGIDALGYDGALNDVWKFDGTRWTWMGGSNYANAPGVYGTQGIADGANLPGARYGATGWTDGFGGLWLFGGKGVPVSAGIIGMMSDLWHFDGVLWTWVSGANSANQADVYGSRGVADPSNSPGGREGANGWIGADGRLWLFGGGGDWYYGAGSPRNDLWTFDGTSWTWVDGAKQAGDKGSYGTEGIASPRTLPSARANAASWPMPDGSLWLYGGWGITPDPCDDCGAYGMLNELWKLVPQ